MAGAVNESYRIHLKELKSKKQSHSLLKVADHVKVSKEENEDPPIGGRNRRSS
jgi:hypothetical protein